MEIKMMNIPNHVGIIMDGNGRWAKEHGHKRSYGHKMGAKTLEKIALHAKNKGIKILTVYAFSTDNFKRSEEEVNYLMDLLVYYFNNKLKSLIKEGFKVTFSGRRDGLRKDVIDAMDSIKERTKDNNDCILNVCLNYGGQEEIVDATKKIVKDVIDNKLDINDLNKDNYYKYLYNEFPPLDLLIRTGREKRLSNFMLYSSTYAELYFVDTYFPDFLEDEFDKALEYYSIRDRRYGGVKKN
jgi:undecaprenyl diphosphate synthase